MSGPLRLYAGAQSGLIMLRGVNDIWTAQNQPRGNQPHFAGKCGGLGVGMSATFRKLVFVGVTFDGLYRTRDAGKHWQRVLEGDIRWVTVDPTDEHVVYAGTEPVRLYRSEDSGDSWEELQELAGPPRGGPGEMVVSPLASSWARAPYLYRPRQR